MTTPAAAEGGDGSGRVRLIRWSGLIPLALVVGALVIGWLLFANAIIRSTAQEALSDLLGTEVDIGRVDLRLRTAAIGVFGLEVADPHDSTRNLAQADEIALDLEALPLLQKKVVIDRVTLRALRFGVARRRPARLAAPSGYAAQTMAAVRTWAAQFTVSPLKLTPIDTIKAVVLDPSQLVTVQRATALAARADSMRGTVERGYASLRLAEALDSAQAVTTRLAGVKPATLGVAGTKKAVEDLRHAVAQVNDARARVDAYRTTLTNGVALLTSDLRQLDEARQKDYAFARGLLKLPSLQGPDIGGALFGQVSIDRIQRLMYWYSLGEKYIPAGLRPDTTSAPARRRLAGTTVRFPTTKGYPDFLLRSGELSFAVGGSLAGAYSATVTNLTSTPALVGVPTRFTARRSAPGAQLAALQVAGMMDRIHARPHDSLAVLAGGFSLPGFALPGLPLRLQPGGSTSDLRFARDGDSVDLRWTIHAGQVAWLADSTRAASLNRIEQVVMRAIAGIPDVEIVTTMTGTLKAPRLRVNSNLDDVVSARLRDVAGAEISRAEARAKAAVDRIVDEKTAPLRARVAEIQADGQKRVDDARAKLDAKRTQLEAQLKSLAGPLGGVIRLPDE